MNPRTYARFGLVAAGLALSGTAAWFNANAIRPAADAATALDEGEPAKAVELLQLAVRRDSSNAYLWADLADALAASGDAARARQCIDRALSLTKAIPAIWVRHANFCFLHNDVEEALRSAARVLHTVPDYDDILFHYFNQIVDDPKRILATIGDQQRATRSWLTYLIRVNKEDAAGITWQRVLRAGYADAPLTASYVEFLLRNRSLAPAQSAWAAFLGKRSGGYPAQNLLFNGKFQAEPLPGPLDWKLRSQDELFETTLANGLVRIQFRGKENVNYDHFSQTAILPHAGQYRLSMHIKTDNLTTNEGLRIAIPDLNLASEPVTGANPWTTVDLEFAVPQARAVRVAVVRRPSQKFDNKIDGVAEIDSIRLTPLSH